jgi:hypothetical protein
MRLQSHHIQLVRQLAEQQVSQRTISQQVGISRDSVRRILQGKVNPKARESPFGSLSLPNDRSPPRRCPRCGGLVHMPCLACSLRDYLRTRALRGEDRAPEKGSAEPASGGRIGELIHSC